jgi:hypothetical protein
MSEQRGPIFIGGLSASGKTQLRVVLDAHRELSLMRRTHLWDRFYGRFGPLSQPENLRRCLAAMEASEDVQRLEPDWRRVRNDLSVGDASYARLFALLNEHHAERGGKRRWGEQLQFVECFAEPIFASFPDARMIHMIRHPGSLTTSHKTLGWEVASWLHSARAADTNRARYPGRYRVVQYEELAARPTETLRAVCEFIGEDFTEAMAETLSTIRFDSAVLDPGAPDEHVASFVDLYAGRALTRLGYEREALPASRRLAQALPVWPVSRMTMAAWRVTRGAPLTRSAKR